MLNAESFARDSIYPFRCFTDAARASFLEADQKTVLSPLLHLGLRRSSFFGKSDRNVIGDTFFGMGQKRALMACFKSHEERITYLRHVASNMQKTYSDDMIIKY